VQLCLIAGCSYEARVSEGHDFCSKTCSRLVRRWRAVLYLHGLNLSWLVCPSVSMGAHLELLDRKLRRPSV
jgi:hypothetical protein